MFHVVQKQLVAYTNAMPDASKHFAYPQLYDELKTVL
jgi:hypothetical protein